ncbi:MAG: hypothetical protein IPJ99_14265 [Betaproteobacteria bacterium]|nr:hypothetical protein [Betaproteobacteria bacterium]MBK8919057.1 hypothetical protein [Betaproteobacteria bacterium]
MAAAAATIRKPVVAAKPAAEKSTRSAKSAAAKPAKIVAPAGKVTRKEAVRSAPGEGAPKADKEAKARKAEKTGKAAKAEPPRQARAEKPRKAKMVRDSFTMPEGEYVRIAGLKKRLLGLKIAAKKSELLRAGIALLDGLKDAELLAAVARVEKVKTGRPAKSGK